MGKALARPFAEKVRQLVGLEDALISGTPAVDAVRQHRDRNGLTDKRARRDYALVRRKWSKLIRDARGHADEYAGLAWVRLEILAKRAAESGDLMTAVVAEQERCRLIGLLPVERDTTERGRPCSGNCSGSSAGGRAARRSGSGTAAASAL